MPEAASARQPAAVEGATILAVFESAERAEESVSSLRRAGFDTAKLSVVGKDDHDDERQIGLAAAGGEIRFWGRRSPSWARLSAMLPGVASLWVTLVGHVVALGPVVSGLVGAGREEPRGAQVSALVAMLRLAGMPTGMARTYEAAVRGGQILVLVHGSSKDVLRARNFLSQAQGFNTR